ncbi:MAG: hypothetical protein JNK12_21585 [Acidimicrobiales bacterium]|nr:hypothetical protein [Acidimicrobiales bacterium]
MPSSPAGRPGRGRVPFCAATSRDLAEPLAATASHVDEWLLVEWPGAWGRHALTESDLPAHLAEPLVTFDRGARAKAVLVRQGVQADAERTSPPMVVRARSTVGDERLTRSALGGPDGWRLDPPMTAPPPVGAGRDEPLLVVCTNGRHDACCANEGRPLVRAMRALGPAPVWECSHIGGDRFAANVVLLPHGCYFGRVSVDAVVGFLEELARGLLPLEHYRGRSALPPPVQAAELAVRQETGERRIDALTGWHRERLGEGAWAVVIDLAGRRHRAEVTASNDAEPRLLTCHSSRPEPPRSFVVGPLERLEDS